MAFIACVLLFVVSAKAARYSFEIDENAYRAGEGQIRLMKERSAIPRYGACWAASHSLVQEGCRRLTGEVHSRLALAYLNCYLQLHGLPSYPCRSDQSIANCTASVSDGDRVSLSQFFIHTQSICYFLEIQAWHGEARETISELMLTSAEVTTKLDLLSSLQSKLIETQNMTLHNQEAILLKADDLNRAISSFSDNVRDTLKQFKESTEYQWSMMNEISDHIAKLRSLFLGEISGFYSLVFYAISVMLCFLLTSTARTKKARPLLFMIMTVNIVAERLVISWETNQDPLSTVVDQHIYYKQCLYRKISCIASFVVLMISAYSYQNLAANNNALLKKIQKQISYLTWLYQSGIGKNVQHSNQSEVSRKTNEKNTTLPHEGSSCISISTCTTGYDTDDSSRSDKTDIKKRDLTIETGQFMTWISGGKYYTSGSTNSGSVNNSTSGPASERTHRYSLRSRMKSM